jgi:D-threo-aldose 1-dehydrogenase
VEGAPDDPSLVPDGRALFVETPTARPVFDFSRSGTLPSLEDSLRRLGLDRVDLVYIHDPDDHYREALEGAYAALHQLRSEEVVKTIGAGTTKTETLVSFAHDADFDVFLVAVRYSLVDTSAGRELLPAYRARGIAVVVGGVFNSGILAAPDATQALITCPQGTTYERA